MNCCELIRHLFYCTDFCTLQIFILTYLNTIGESYYNKPEK